MKYLLSLLFYYIGDIISRTFMRWGDGYGYGIYQRVMEISINLDENCRIWKKVTGKKNKKK